MRTSIFGRARRPSEIDFSDLANGFDLLAVANVPNERGRPAMLARKVVDRRDQTVHRRAEGDRGRATASAASRRRAYIEGLGRDRNGATDRVTAATSAR